MGYLSIVTPKNPFMFYISCYTQKPIIGCIYFDASVRFSLLKSSILRGSKHAETIFRLIFSAYLSHLSIFSSNSSRNLSRTLLIGILSIIRSKKPSTINFSASSLSIPLLRR